MMKKLQEYVDDINENIEKLDTRGPVSKYVLPDENLRGTCVFFLAIYITVIFLLHLSSLKKLPCVNLAHLYLLTSLIKWLYVGSLSCRLTITFDETMSGIACDLHSRGYLVLCEATKKVVGYVKPFSVTGSLPLVHELQVR